MKQSTDTATMNSSAMLSLLEICFGAFAEKDADRRGDLLAGCLTPDAAIWGHSQVFVGHAAISEKIAGFHVNFQDCRLVLASGLFAFGNIVRFGNALVRPDGSVVARGETVMEIARDGRIGRVVPLWDKNLPPLPGGWPEHLAVPPAPKVSSAA